MHKSRLHLENEESDRHEHCVVVAYTEFNSVETPEFKAIIDPLDEQLRSLVETDEEADEYMNVVFELCASYEKHSYIEGLKVGARLMMELAED